MTAFLTKLGFTRDSVAWFWMQIVALAGLITSGLLDPHISGFDPAIFGIPESAVHKVSILAIAVLWISAKYSSSGLQSKAEASRLTVTKIGAGVGAVILACALGFGLVSLPACGGVSVKTNVSAVADVANAGGKIEDSAHAIFIAAEQGNAAINPSTGKPLVSQDALDRVAMAVNKIGHLGIDLRHGLDDYTAAKAAGRDVTAQAAVVQKVLADLTQALGDIGHAIPRGTIAQIDALVVSVLQVVNQVKGVVTL